MSFLRYDIINENGGGKTRRTKGYWKNCLILRKTRRLKEIYLNFRTDIMYKKGILDSAFFCVFDLRSQCNLLLNSFVTQQYLKSNLKDSLLSSLSSNSLSTNVEHTLWCTLSGGQSQTKRCTAKIIYHHFVKDVGF